MNCITAQALLFDYLFDVLDQDEKQPLENHLAKCGKCTNELIWAKNQQKLLKSASMDSFPRDLFRVEDLLVQETTHSSSQKTGKSPIIPQWALMVAALALLLVLPVWAMLWKRDVDQEITLAFVQDSGQPGKTVVSMTQLEKTVSSAISLVQRGSEDVDVGHKALSIPKTTDSESGLKTIVFVSDTPLKPGTVFEVKSVTLQTASLKLAQDPLDIRFDLRGPGFERSISVDGKGSTPKNLPAKFADGSAVSGIGLVLFDLPKEISGGPWELVVSESRGRFPTVRKAIAIEGNKSEYTQAIRWNKEQYKAGDKARLTVRLNQADTKAVVGAKINITLVIGGVPWNPESKGSRKATLERVSNENGECILELEMPQKPVSGQNEILIQSRIGESFLSEKYPIPLGP